MTPIEPRLADLLPGRAVTFAKDQPEYKPLPAFVIEDGQGSTASRWRLSMRERVAVLLRGELYVSLSTFGRPLQPIRIATDRKEFAAGWTVDEAPR